MRDWGFFKLAHGDSADVLKLLPDNSVDSIVTDPPYGLAFMGKRWDYDVPSEAVWAECLRVLKPGGHMLAFAGARTQHRMAVRIEDGGFEIRDMLAWVYGSGFPKSLDVSKAIDAAAGAEREVIGTRKFSATNSANFRDDGWVPDLAKLSQVTAPATDAAREWEGWGTALKPALEPITLARKPLGGTVAANVQQWRTGALNIGECRVPTDDNLNGGAYSRDGRRSESPALHAGSGMNQPGKTAGVEFVPPSGRWPANLLHDGSDEVLQAFPAAPGQMGVTGNRSQGGVYGTVTNDGEGVEPRGDTGSAARFFYCAKASRSERGAGNNHPTVKPLALMRYLCRMVTPPGGLVLDPFMGSGSTGVAAVQEGFKWLGIDREESYVEIAQGRLLELLTSGAIGRTLPHQHSGWITK